MSNKTIAAVIALILMVCLVPFAAAEDDFIPAGTEDKPFETPPPTISEEPAPEHPAPVTSLSVIPATQAVMRTGLFYSNNALPSANLANEVGSGYLFGYFDKAGSFTVLGSTAEEKITVLKDKNIYIRDGVYYDSLPPSGASTIGAWHTQSSDVYASFDEAKAASSDGAFPAYINGEYRVRGGSYTSDADAAAAGAAVGNSATCYTVVVTATGRILFEFDMGEGIYFGILPTGNERPVTWFKQYQYNGGFEYKRMKGNDITVVNVALLGDYTRGVVPYEVGPEWHDEALKTAALCASSYAVYMRDRHRTDGFDVCNGIHCQVYNGLNRATAKTNAACDAVAGYAVYYDGKVCNTVYHSTNGGMTEAAKNVWGTDYAYLQPVADTYEDLDAAYRGRWTTVYTGEEIAWILTQKGEPIGTVTKAYVELTAAGNVFRITFEDAKGTKKSFSMERVRTILTSDTLKKSMYSQRFTILTGSAVSLVVGDDKQVVSAASSSVIRGDGTVETIANASQVYVATASGIETLTGGGDDGVFTFVGTGWGHNVGLSQWGAKGRAEAGWTYDQIIKYYYTGVEILKVQ